MKSRSGNRCKEIDMSNASVATRSPRPSPLGPGIRMRVNTPRYPSGPR